jgi:hypothetical protein
MRPIAVFSLVLFLALPARAEGPSPENAVRAFYAWVLAHPSISLPSARQRAQLAKMLAPELVQLLKEASDMEARCVKVAPKDEKPLILEGNLFVGNLEGATEVAYRLPDSKDTVVRVDADLIYVDSRFPKGHKYRAVAWKDRVELRQAGARWLVQDVKFQNDGSLAGGLKEYLADGARTCVRPVR